MTGSVWQCPKCARQIKMDWDGWEFAKNSHENGHKAKPSGPRSGGGSSGGGFFGKIGDFVGDVIEGIFD